MALLSNLVQGIGISGYSGTPGPTLVYSTNIGNGSANTFTITHNLGTDVLYTSVRDTTSGYYTFPDTKYIDTNNIQVEFVDAPTSNQYVVLVFA